jgi:hypothetical protein
MVMMSGRWLDLRQWIFPHQFRIPTGEWATLASAIAEALAEIKGQEVVDELMPSFDPAFAVSLCNQYFRLRRNTESLAAGGKETREVRALKGALTKIAELFEEHQIEYRDLTGQTYDDTRIDFEPIGDPERVAGLTKRKISQCENPAVLVRGKLVQKARGVVAIPA